MTKQTFEKSNYRNTVQLPWSRGLWGLDWTRRFLVLTQNGGGGGAFAVLAAWIACFLLLTPARAEQAASSDDGYIKSQGTWWVLGTASVEKVVALEEGKFQLRSFKSKASGQELVVENVPSDEFSVLLGEKAERVSGATGGWQLVGSQTQKLKQGELQLDITLRRDSLQVTKSYVVYPKSSIIREWVSFKNIGSSSLKIADPGFLNFASSSGNSSSLDFLWMSGGENSPGSWNIHTEALSQEKPRTFDSNEPHKVGDKVIGEYGFRSGSSTYAPWCALFNRDSREGLFIGWDYFGHWTSSYALDPGGAVRTELKLAGYHKNLSPGESVTTPKAFVGLYQGDLDNAGNECLDWQYRYLWDYTRPQWCPAVRMVGCWTEGGTWGKTWDGSGADFGSIYREAFKVADLMSYCGGDVYHRDWGWWGLCGDWDGPDWRSVNNYLHKHDMGLLLYGFLYAAAQDSRVGKAHRDWFMPDQRTFDLSRPEVVEFIKAKLDEWYDNWGPFEWRNDGGFMEPGQGPTAKYDQESPLLGQDQGFRKVLQDFLDKHRDCEFQGVNGGGPYAGYEYTRFSGVFSFSDGAVGPLENYYASLMLPPDKTEDIPEKFDVNKFDKATWHGLLSFNFATVHYTWDPVKLDGVREQVDIYHYLHHEGVVGRWVKVYRPLVQGDDPTMYFQRLSGDRKRGIIILKHVASGPITIKPKGLLPKVNYVVSYQESDATAKRTGADLMENGVRIEKMLPGELVYLNLPLHPGSKLDTQAPGGPKSPTKSEAKNMGYPGVELAWKPGKDNKWISYYDIFRNGVFLDKVAKGTFYFDHSLGADLAAEYEVRSVDGAGNVSKKVAAKGPAAKPAVIYDDAPSGGIMFTGAWKQRTNARPAYAGTLTLSNEKGATAEVKLSGRKVLWFTKLGPDCGKAEVSLDGGAPEVVDTYSADEIPGICIYEKELPSTEEHTLRIKVLGEHAAHPADYPKDTNSPSIMWVNVDGVRAEQ